MNAPAINYGLTNSTSGKQLQKRVHTEPNYMRVESSMKNAFGNSSSKFSPMRNNTYVRKLDK